MRIAIAVGVLLVLASPALAKYDPCSSRGAPWLLSELLPSNAKIWLANTELAVRSIRVRGGGIDRVVKPTMQRGIRVLDLGVLAPGELYELAMNDWDWTFGWFITTGEDHTAPQPPSIRALALTHPSDRDHSASDDAAEPDFLRTPANDLAIDLELSDDTVLLDVELSDGVSPVLHTLMWREDLPLFGRTSCGPQVHLVAGARACLSIRAVDVAGNTSDAALRCTTVADVPGDSRRSLRSLLRFPTTKPLEEDASPLLLSFVLAICRRARSCGGRAAARRRERRRTRP